MPLASLQLRYRLFLVVGLPDAHAVDQGTFRRFVLSSRGLCSSNRALAQSLWVSSLAPTPDEEDFPYTTNDIQRMRNF